MDFAVDLLLALPAEFTSFGVVDSALTPRRLGAAGLFPRGSPEDAVAEGGPQPLPFAALLPGFEPPVAHGRTLPIDGSGLPLPEALTPPLSFVPVREPLSARSVPQKLTAIPRIAPGRVTDVVTADSPRPMAERAPLTELNPLNFGVPQAADAQELLPPGSRIELAPASTPGPLARAAVGAAQELRATRLRSWPPADIPSQTGSLQPDGNSRDRTPTVDPPIKLDGGHTDDLTRADLRGIFRSVSGFVDAEPVGPTPAVAPVMTVASTGASAAPLRIPETPTAMNMAVTRWSEALASRVHWMIDQDLGAAHIKLNPPELGALDIRISMVDEKAYVQLVASESATRELLETALPRLRELLIGGGLELADASVSDGSRESRAAHSIRAAIAEDAPPELAEGPVAVAAKRPSGHIDLYA